VSGAVCPWVAAPDFFSMTRLRAVAALAAAGAAWGHFEAGWARLDEIECPLPGLPPELDGLRIVHLSDFHLGLPSRGARAVERAVDWAAARRPELVVVTGDLLSRPSGERKLRALLERLPNCYAILGNHDFAISRDPFAQRTHLRDLGSATLLSDEGVTVELRGRRVYIAGADPRSRWVATRRRPRDLAEPDADLRVLLLHYPELVEELPPRAFDLVLAGHMHGGQISLPYPGGKLRFAHLRASYTEGLYALPNCVLHVSRGLGTTFVPFRFGARPEATELRLRSA
jgi:predicted MPP superfamily phosphohydrolase